MSSDQQDRISPDCASVRKHHHLKERRYRCGAAVSSRMSDMLHSFIPGTCVHLRMGDVSIEARDVVSSGDPTRDMQ